MPYIKQEQRKRLDPVLNKFIEAICVECWGNESLDGVLNYCIAKMCHTLYPRGYIHYNAMIGMLECCKQELYRRVVVPYETEKLKENEDVFSVGCSTVDHSKLVSHGPIADFFDDATGQEYEPPPV